MSILLASSLQSVLELVGVLVIFAFVLFLTWLTTRWLGNYQKGHSNSKNLSVVETIRMGNNKTISIIKAGKRYFVVSAGKDEIRTIGELSEDELSDLSFQNSNIKSGTTGKESFSSILSKFKGSLPGKQDQDEQD